MPVVVVDDGEEHLLQVVRGQPGHPRARAQVVKRALVQQASGVDYAHVVGHELHFAQQVGGDQHRAAAAFRQRADERAYLVYAHGVQAVGGLVEQQHRRLAQQRPGQAEALLHAQGVLPGPASGELAQPHGLQRGDDRALRQAEDAPDDVQVFLAGEVGVKGRLLDKRADGAEYFHPVVRIGEAVYAHGAGAGLYQAEHHLHGGALARPVGAEKTVDAALAHVHLQAGDRREAAVALGEVVCFDSVHAENSFAECDPSITRLPCADIFASLRLPYKSQGFIRT